MKKKRGKEETRKFLEVKDIFDKLNGEVSKVVVGQKDAIRGIFRGIICGGHVLVEGVPGVAKTLMVRAISRVLGCSMKRVQFTVDLLPTDITGIMGYDPKKGFEIVKGPIFTNFVLADEINRSPPKTQSALLEAMQEGSVTISKKTYELPKPFFVMATENPLEVSGVYPLPEAQVDRFLFKLLVGYPNEREEEEILKTNVTLEDFESFRLKKILNAEKILYLQSLVKEVFTSPAIEEYIVRLVRATREKDKDYSKYISYGGSPRASIALYIASKAEALINGRDYVIPRDVRAVAFTVLRHRIILNYEAQADEVGPDDIIKKIMTHVRAP